MDESTKEESMNERIKELESETWREMEKLGKVKWSDWRDKFAELIIQECIIRAEREWIRNGDTEHNRAVSKVIGSIKEHFGLEQ
jgi:hypothetical protein